MPRVTSIIQHRIDLQNDTVAATVTLIAPGLATDRRAKGLRVRARSVTRNKTLPRAAVNHAIQAKVQAQSAKRLRTPFLEKAVRAVKNLSQHDGPTSENQLNNIRWSEWSEPLD